MTSSATSSTVKIAHHVTDAVRHVEPNTIFSFITDTLNSTKTPIDPHINIEHIVSSVTTHLDHLPEHSAAKPLAILLNNLEKIQFDHKHAIMNTPEFKLEYDNLIYKFDEIIVKYKLNAVDSSPTGKIIGSPFGFVHVAEHGLEKAIHLAIQHTKELTGESEFLNNLKINISTLYSTNTQGNAKLITSKLVWLGTLIQTLKPIIGFTIGAVFLCGLWKSVSNITLPSKEKDIV